MAAELERELRPAVQHLRDFVAQGEGSASAAVMEHLTSYLRLLLRVNRRANLVGPLSPEEMAQTLICDSLQVLRVCPQPLSPVVDVGSGAGLPGIPIKILRPELEVHLVEPRAKRQAFLGLVLRQLALTGITRHALRIEDFEEEVGSATSLAMGCAVSKAFAPLERWLPLAARLVRPGGDVVALCSAAHWQALGASPLEVAPNLVLQGALAYTWPQSTARLALHFKRGPLPCS